ncbi:hypothetical protein Cgig2_001408 [Carnegiea gigantea]|uniref:Cytochrome P450 n=1 Tax=Carnegiea gigantea TaxID=171969 RepID=A0A9Q1KUN3_9CARY|nr:hypothetical protein Cgig2_001408 [Carnegiea gigantea]
MILLFIIFFFLIFFLLTLLLRPSNASKPNHGFKTYPILGGLPEFLANRHRFYDWTTDVIRSHPTHTAILFSPGRVGIMTALPQNVEHILKTRFDNYSKGPQFASVLRDFLGSGILNSDGDLWRIQHRTAAFTFSHRNLATFVFDAVRSEISTRLLPLLREASQSGRVIDLQK